MCIDDIERSSSYSLKDIAKCSTIPCENVPLLYYRRWKWHPCQEILGHLANWFRIFLWTNTPTPLELVTKNISAIWIPGSNLPLSILGTISYHFQFNSSKEASVLKCIYQTAPTASDSIAPVALAHHLHPIKKKVEEWPPKSLDSMMCFPLTTLILVYIPNSLWYTYHAL